MNGTRIDPQILGEKITIAAAGNVLPAALAALNRLGYVVTADGRFCKAENGHQSFLAEDVLSLLGLVKLQEVRGNEWQPTDTEVDNCLVLDVATANAAYERADVWEENGAVHVICVSAFGDPVELSEEAAREFAGRLSNAIDVASR